MWTGSCGRKEPHDAHTIDYFIGPSRAPAYESRGIRSYEWADFHDNVPFWHISVRTSNRAFANGEPLGHARADPGRVPAAAVRAAAPGPSRAVVRARGGDSVVNSGGEMKMKLTQMSRFTELLNLFEKHGVVISKELREEIATILSFRYHDGYRHGHRVGYEEGVTGRAKSKL